MKLALVYDWVDSRGGAEVVLEELLRIWPDAPIYTTVWNPNVAEWSRHYAIRTSFIQKLPGIASSRIATWLLAAYAFEQVNFDAYDVVISISSADAKCCITKPKTVHICYLLTPTRYAWSHSDAYVSSLSTSFVGRPLKACVRKFLHIYRLWDVVAAQRPDKIVSISSAVQQRCLEYYGRKSDLCFPPVLTETKTTAAWHDTRLDEQSKFFLGLGRLVSYKRFDLVCEVAQLRPDELFVIAGTGPELQKLQQNSPKNVLFVGRVSEAEKWWLLQHAQAFLLPQEEDFGIVAVEAMSCGTPVLAYKKGGALDTVIDGKTGIFFEQQTPEHLSEAINSWKNHTWYDKNIKEHAKSWNSERFRQAFKNYVEATWQRNKR